MDTMEYFSERLKKLREEKGISQTELGEALGISRSSISFYEKSERVPDIELLSDMARYFEVPVDYLLGLSNAKSTNEPELKAICDYTGLSEEAVKILHEQINDNGYFGNRNEVFDIVIRNGDFLQGIYSYREKATDLLSFCSAMTSGLDVDIFSEKEKNKIIDEINSKIKDTRLAYFDLVEFYKTFLNENISPFIQVRKEARALIERIQKNKEVKLNGNDNETE